MVLKIGLDRPVGLLVGHHSDPIHIFEPTSLWTVGTGGWTCELVDSLGFGWIEWFKRFFFFFFFHSLKFYLSHAFIMMFKCCSFLFLQCALYWSGGDCGQRQYSCSVRRRTSGLPSPEILYSSCCHWNDKLTWLPEDKTLINPFGPSLRISLSFFPTFPTESRQGKTNTPPRKWSKTLWLGEVVGMIYWNLDSRQSKELQ